MTLVDVAVCPKQHIQITKLMANMRGHESKSKQTTIDK